MSKGTPEYHPAEEEIERELDESERELDFEEESESESERSFREAIDTAASQAQDAARSSITSSLVSETTTKALVPHQNPYEAFSRGNPSPRFDAVMARATAALSQLTASDVSRAHAAFVERGLGIDLSGLPADKRGAEADRLLTALTLKVQGKAVPSSGNAAADAKLQALTDEFLGLKDVTFWKAMVDGWRNQPVTVAEAVDHMLFLRAVEDLTPPRRDSNNNLNPPRLIWNTKAVKLLAIDKILAAGGAAPDPNANPPGRIDIAAMYRQAASTTSRGDPIPRAMAIELVRLALAQLVQGASVAMRSQTPKPVHEPGYDALKRGLRSEPTPPQAAPKTDQEAVEARNAARDAALDLLGPESNKTLKDKGGVDRLGRLTMNGLVELSYRGRRDLGQVLNSNLSDLSLLLIRQTPKEEGLPDVLATAAAGSGLDSALSRWSELYTSSNPSPGDLASSLKEVKAAMEKFSQALGANFDGSRKILLRANWLIEALRGEVVREAGEVLPDPAKPQAVPDTGTPLGAARTTVELASVQGRSRRAAIIGREALGGLGKFTAQTLKGVADRTWAKDLTVAADAWTTADGIDGPSLLAGTDVLTTSLDKVRLALANAAPEDRYTGLIVIDALATAVSDRISALASVGAGVSSAEATGRLTALEKLQLVRVEPAKLGSYWSKGKNTISGDLPRGLNLDLTTRIGAWAASVADNPVDLKVVNLRTISVTQAVTDYHVRIEASKDLLPADRATLLTLLDTVLATMSTRLAALDS